MKWRAILLCALLIFSGCKGSEHMTGTGTALDPYIITTRADLETINNDLTAHYELGADIDLSGTDWVPLGSVGWTQFSGSFDGKGHTIANMHHTYQDANMADNFGLFWSLAGATGTITIQNLLLRNPSVIVEDSPSTFGPHNVGFLAGYAEQYASMNASISISNVFVCNGSMSILSSAGGNNFGLLFGYISSIDPTRIALTNCQTIGTMTFIGEPGNIGGIAGFLTGGGLTRCSGKLTVTFTGSGYRNIDNIGGIACNFGGVATDSIGELTIINVNKNDLTNIGGFTGTSQGGQYIRCKGKAIVVAGNGTNLGGFIGISDSSDIYADCSAEGSISSDEGDGTGGFTGQLAGTFTRCSSSTDVTGRYWTGGFSGSCSWQANISCTDCYALGDVISTLDSAGGFCGQAPSDSVFTHCYSGGEVVASGDNTGGFCGSADASAIATSCYWDTETSGQTTSPLGEGKTTAEMQTQSTFTGWDFSTVWNIASGTYPFLRTAFVTLVDRCAIVHSFPWVGRFQLTHVT
jgi:hypothetical protein